MAIKMSRVVDAGNVCLSEKRMEVSELIFLCKPRWSWARIKCGIEGGLAEENHPPALRALHSFRGGC